MAHWLLFRLRVRLFRADPGVTRKESRESFGKAIGGMMAQEKTRVRFLFTVGLSLLFMITGCYSGVVVIEEHPPPAPTPPPKTSPYSHEPPAGKGPPPWAPAHGYRAKHRYHYYPPSYVYYDVGRKLYFYYDGGDWRVSVSLPSAIHVDVYDYVTVEMDTDKPYEYHSEVMKKYPPGQEKKYYKGKGKGKGKKW